MNNIPADIADFLDSIAQKRCRTPNGSWYLSSGVVGTAKELCIKHGIWKEQDSTPVEPTFDQTNGTNGAKALVEWLELISTTRSLNPESIAKQAIVETLLGALTEEGRSHHCRQLTESLALQEEWKSLSRQMEVFYPSMSLERERKSNGTSQAREATLAFLHESLQKAKDHTFELAYKAIVENYQAQRATT